MKRTPVFLIMVLMGLFVVPGGAAEANTVVRTGESISLEKTQRIEGDFYSLASILNISGEITEDLVAAGGEVTLNGTVAEDAVLLGGNVDVHGSVGEDLRVVGGSVVIAEPVTGDVLVMGGTVTILSTASIGGDLIVYGGEVKVSGSVGGDIIGHAESMRLDAPITGNVEVEALSLVIGDNADIKGTVRYVSEETLTRAQNAKIEGEVTRNDPVIEKPQFDGRVVIIPVLVLLFSALVWYMIARPFLNKIVTRALTRSVRPTLTGLLVFFASPAIIIILTVSILGTFVGIASFFAYILAVMLALVSSTVVLGHAILTYGFKQTANEVSPLTLAVGVIAAVVCAIIPVLGTLILVTAFVVALGALIDVILRPAT